MKNVRVTIYFIMFILIVSVANSENPSKKNKIGFEYNYIKSYLTNSNQFGLNYELFIYDNISLQYGFRLGLPNGRAAFHCHTGLATALYMLYDDNYLKSDAYYSNNDFYNYAVIFLAMVPEGINIYVPYTDKIKFSPMIMPLGFDYINDKYSITSSIGMKMEWNFIEELSLNPFVNVTMFYKESKFFFNAGFFLGIKF